MGPFRLLDELGLDVACHVGPVLENGLKHNRFAVDSKIEQLVKDGFLGKKNKKGLYQYDDKLKALGMNTAVTSKYLNAKPDATFPGGLLQYVDHRGAQDVVDKLNRLRDESKDDRFTPAQILVDMAKGNKKFFPNRPFVPYQERTGFPSINL